MQDDKVLARGLKKGETAAFRKCYHTYVQKLYVFTLRMAKSPELAEDIVHDVFVKIWKNRHQIDPEKSLQAYLFTVTRNHLLNFIKRRAHEESIIDQMMTNAATAQNNETRDRILYNESHRLFHEAIEQLPVKRKEIFQLCHLEGLTYEEAAEQLEITSSTVNSQMVKARKFIKEYLTSKNSFPQKE